LNRVVATATMDSVEQSVASGAEDLFKEFEQKFGKTYKSVEERAMRIAHFAENVARIEEMQKNDPSAKYSVVTPLADWSKAEFAARNTLQVPKELMQGEVELLDTSYLPTDFDWVAKGAVNDVKNQEQCGSCWAFSAVANVEGVNFVKTGTLLSLSEQELVDCDTLDHGCEGGRPSQGMDQMAANRLGLELESQYPYTASDGQCSAEMSDEKVFVSGHKDISQDEDQIAAALIKYGPLAIGINAGPMQMYHGGVANPADCDPQGLDHGVAIVGFGVDGGQKYWKIRNSWGPSWGEDGYYRIVRGVGKCGLNRVVATATMDSVEQSVAILV